MRVEIADGAGQKDEKAIVAAADRLEIVEKVAHDPAHRHFRIVFTETFRGAAQKGLVDVQEDAALEPATTPHGVEKEPDLTAGP
jgi:hypothetical protein